jgi:hypothetical protein
MLINVLYAKSIDKQTDLSLEEEDKFNLLISTFAFQQLILCENNKDNMCF